MFSRTEMNGDTEPFSLEINSNKTATLKILSKHNSFWRTVNGNMNRIDIHSRSNVSDIQNFKFYYFLIIEYGLK